MAYTGERVEKLNGVNKHGIGKIPHKKTEYEYIEEEMLVFFPQSKYFQIHFQHCHETVDELNQELIELKHQISSVEEKLDRIMKMLDRQAESI